MAIYLGRSIFGITANHSFAFPATQAIFLPLLDWKNEIINNANC